MHTSEGCVPSILTPIMSLPVSVKSQIGRGGKGRDDRRGMAGKYEQELCHDKVERM